MAISFFGYAIESAYLLRRWGRFAVNKLTIDVQKDETVTIRLHRHKKWFLSDGYHNFKKLNKKIVWIGNTFLINLFMSKMSSL